MYRSFVVPATAGLAVIASLLVSSHTHGPPEAIDAGADRRAPYIVEGTSVTAARAAIDRVGGKVTSALDIIDGVAAELTDAQRASLQRERDIRRVFPDAQVKVAVASAAPATSTVADRFDAVKYTNDDGTH